MVEMRSTNTRIERIASQQRLLLLAFLLLDFSSIASAYTPNRYFARNPNPKPRPARWGPPEKRDGSIPLVISNNCDDTVWPGIGTQAGTGGGTGGFELSAGSSKSLTVSPDWQGRVWGRTNCSFNAAGTGASNLNGNNGGGAACSTGDCGGVLDCVMTVSISLNITQVCILTIYREQLLSPSRNSILRVEVEAHKHSTTSLLSMATTFL